MKKTTLWLTTGVLILAGVLLVPDALAAETSNPLNVRGQRRNLKMALVLKNKRDKVKFVKIRKNYKKEIEAGNF